MRKPEERFGREFHMGLWRTLRGLRPIVRRIVLAAFLILLLYALSGGRAAVLYSATIIAACLIFVTQRRAGAEDWMPGDRELAAIDEQRAIDEADAFEASGKGAQAFEFALNALLGLVGREVTVLIGTDPSALGRPRAMLSGELGTGRNIAADDSYELLFFEVGATGNGFYVDRTQFLRGYGHARHSDDAGLELWDPDGVTWVYEDAPVEHR